MSGLAAFRTDYAVGFAARSHEGVSRVFYIAHSCNGADREATRLGEAKGRGARPLVPHKSQRFLDAFDPNHNSVSPYDRNRCAPTFVQFHSYKNPTQSAGKRQEVIEQHRCILVPAKVYEP